MQRPRHRSLTQNSPPMQPTPQNQRNSIHFQDKPMAAKGLISYRYKDGLGYIMIGASDNADALSEAQRSTSEKVVITNLEKWDGEKYQKVNP